MSQKGGFTRFDAFMLRLSAFASAFHATMISPSLSNFTTLHHIHQTLRNKTSSSHRIIHLIFSRHHSSTSPLKLAPPSGPFPTMSSSRRHALSDEQAQYIHPHNSDGPRLDGPWRKRQIKRPNRLVDEVTDVVQTPKRRKVSPGRQDLAQLNSHYEQFVSTIKDHCDLPQSVHDVRNHRMSDAKARSDVAINNALDAVDRCSRQVERALLAYESAMGVVDSELFKMQDWWSGIEILSLGRFATKQVMCHADLSRSTRTLLDAAHTKTTKR